MSTEPGHVARTPLSAATLSRSVVRPGGFWRSVVVTDETGSTNADLLARAADGADEGTVLVAEAQTAGRGRLGRSWLSPPRAALMFSVLLRPAAVPQPRRGWAPLLAGVAVASGVNGLTGLDVGLKWPNDVLVGGAKLAGILAEQSADAIVVGIGINVSTQRDELPVETATSLALEGAAGTSRAELFGAVLGEFERLYQAWTHSAEPGDADAAGLRREYRDRSGTLGSEGRGVRPRGAVGCGTPPPVGPHG